MVYRGSCHCGRVVYQVEGEISKAIACNCSICQRKGSLLWFVPRDKFTLLTPPDNEKSYLFNKHHIEHRFCTECGIHSYASGSDATGNATVAINVRCLEDIDLSTISVTQFDGRNKA